MFKLKLFYSSIRESLFKGKLKQAQVEGCNKVINEWEKRAIEDKRILAYILATVYHETGRKMKPINEYGNADYFEKSYDINGDNPRLAKELGNNRPGDGAKYHGRGYSMITGKDNYKRFGQRYGINLVKNPDLALDPNIAMKILFDGMIYGMFTGRKLSDYIFSKRVDYKGARWVINRQDQAEKIAGYARKFEKALVDAKVDSTLLADTQAQATLDSETELYIDETILFGQQERLGAEQLYKDELIIRPDYNGQYLQLPSQEIKRIVLVDCVGVIVDLRHVTFNPNHNKHVPLVEIRGGENNKVMNINYHQNYTGWSVNQWENARKGVLVGGKNNQVEGVSLKGVRVGIELEGIQAKAKQVYVTGFSYDAVRMLASKTELDTAEIKDAYLANKKNHCDAVQIFPKVPPEKMHEVLFDRVKVQNVQITNRRNKPGGIWMQGVFMTDGRLTNGRFSNIYVDSDHQHGFSLAEAHDCILENVHCTSPNRKVISHISCNTSKLGYKASRGIQMKNCNADLILIN